MEREKRKRETVRVASIIPPPARALRFKKRNKNRRERKYVKDFLHSELGGSSRTGGSAQGRPLFRSASGGGLSSKPIGLLEPEAQRNPQNWKRKARGPAIHGNGVSFPQTHQGLFLAGVAAPRRFQSARFKRSPLSRAALNGKPNGARRAPATHTNCPVPCKTFLEMPAAEWFGEETYRLFLLWPVPSRGKHVFTAEQFVMF
ncbi:hypothetical protein AAFF_G00220630 [Aldrovandia affinis]|uniref:Uncharacterized protein n=1 Tax=Aldrovandia affinis TaxID=143900 RepID=A0AAD7RGG1_9TELE|nr:hypothetical protein AAFF_G00220630 [Aldrovandia affinis]